MFFDVGTVENMEVIRILSNMNTYIFSDKNPDSKRYAIFEDDGVSGWLYITGPDDMTFIGDCWIYNRIPAPDPIIIGAFRPGPPPAPQGFAGPNALQALPDWSSIRLLWSDDGNAVALLMNNLPVGFVVADDKRGVSRHLANNGPWGLIWNQELYDKNFIDNNR